MRTLRTYAVTSYPLVYNRVFLQLPLARRLFGLYLRRLSYPHEKPPPSVGGGRERNRTRHEKTNAP